MKPTGKSATLVWESLESEWSEKFNKKYVDVDSSEHRNFILNDLKNKFPHLKELMLQEAMRRAGRNGKPQCSTKAYITALQMFLE